MKTEDWESRTAVDLELRIKDWGLGIEDSGLRIEDWGQGRGPRTRTEDWGPRTEDRGPRTKDQLPRTNYQGPITKDLGPRPEDWGPRTHTFWVWPLGPKISSQNEESKNPCHLLATSCEFLLTQKYKKWYFPTKLGIFYHFCHLPTRQVILNLTAKIAPFTCLRNVIVLELLSVGES